MRHAYPIACMRIRAFDYQILKEQLRFTSLFKACYTVKLVELVGFEPTTAGLQSRCSAN